MTVHSIRLPTVLLGLLIAGCGAAPKPAVPTALPSADGAATSPDPAAVEPAPVAEASEVDTTEAASLLSEGRQLAMDGDTSAARGAFQDAAEAAPQLAEPHYNLAVLAEWDGNLAMATQHYGDALRVQPTFGAAVLGLANLKLRRGDTAGALQVARAALAKDPKSNSLRNALNRIRLESPGRADEVIRDTKAVLRLDEKNVSAMINLAAAYGVQGKHELSEAILGNAKALSPEDPEILGRLAVARMAMGEKLKARLALEEATRLPGGATAEIYNNLGLVYHEAGDFPGAEQQFLKALARWPSMMAAQINLGNALKGQKKFREADEAFQKALVAEPKNPKLLYNLAILYLDGQRDDLDPIKRLEQSLDYFGRYGAVAKVRPAKTPVDAYIKEAKKRLVVENKRAEQKRRQAKEPAEPEESSEDDASEDDVPEDGVPEGAASGDATAADDEDEK